MARPNLVIDHAHYHHAMIVIHDYKSSWPEDFESLRATLQAILGALALRIDHIGSTSVPGLGAKDVIDIQITVLALTPDVKEKLIQAGYKYWPALAHDHVPLGESSSPELWAKFLFTQPKGQRRANVHVRIEGNPNQLYPLLFRDYLRAHPNSARSIALIKREIAKRHADDSDAYDDIKDPVYDLIYEAALEWAKHTGWKLDEPPPPGARGSNSVPERIAPAELAGLLDFLRRAERLKDTVRSGYTSGGRQESVADHTWRLCLMALLLYDRFPSVDFARLVKLCLIHDLGEAINGDIPAPEQAGLGVKADRERRDLLELLSPLPPHQQGEITALWDEYEAASTPEARLAKALDKLETLLQHTQGANPPDFDYRFNLGYGRQFTSGAPIIEAIRQILDEETERRARESEGRST